MAQQAPNQQHFYSDLNDQVDKIVQQRLQIVRKMHECQHVLSKQNQVTPQAIEKFKRDLNLSFFNVATSNCEQTQITLQNINIVMDDLQVQSNIVHNKLSIWKREQQLANNGYSSICSENSLDKIQQFIASLSDSLCSIRKILYKLLSEMPIILSILRDDASIYSLQDSISKSIGQVEEQIKNLVRWSFVICKQPPQVMKTNTKFLATIALLTGNKFNSDANLPMVQAYLINNHEASQFLANPTLEQVKKRPAKGDSGANEILNNSASFEIDPSNGQVISHFRNMQLKRIKRTEKKGAESVMEEKFAILFTASMQVLKGQPEVFVWTMSFPVVVIVHGNQEPHAWATITWDNAFAEPSRKVFNVVESVAWEDLAHVLMMKFELYTKSKLTQQDLQFLGSKILRKEMTYESLQQQTVAWNLFAREDLPDRTFTFWAWFFSILKVSREHLKNFLPDKMVVGFLTRKQTEEMLLQCVAGTFLLRFSDSELGSVTIAWVCENQDGMKEVSMVQPFNSRDLTIRGLADRVRDLNNLTYLYPNIPKDHVFGRFYSPNLTKSTNGYVTPVLALTLPGYSSGQYESESENSNHQLYMQNINSVQSPSDVLSNGIGQYSSECSPESSSLSSVCPEYIDYNNGNSNAVWHQMPQIDVENQYMTPISPFPH